VLTEGVVRHPLLGSSGGVQPAGVHACESIGAQPVRIAQIVLCSTRMPR
jgi:hypothetical protein